MKKSPVLITIVLLLSLTLLLSACKKTGSTDGSNETKQTPENPAVTETKPVEPAVVERETVKLKIATVPYISNTILMIAESEGYFDEQDLDVEFVSFPNTNDIVPLVLAGELDAGPPSPNAAFFNAISRGGKIKIILPLTDFTVKDCATVAFLARTSDVEAGIYTDKKTWKDAKLVVSTQALNSIPGYVLGKILEPVGLTVEDMKIEVVEIAAQEEALRNKQIDILYAVEPAITRMTAKGDISILDNAEQYVPGLASSVIVAGPKIIDNPDVGRRFAIAYLKAVRQYMQGPTTRNVEIAQELTKLSPELISKMCWSNSSLDGKLNVQSLLDYEQWLMKRGLLDKMIEPTEFYDPSFAESAVKELGVMQP
jgi:NitT/TauT family transport system substrate-binding protein